MYFARHAEHLLAERLVNRQGRLAKLRARPVYPKRGDGVGTSGLRLS